MFLRIPPELRISERKALSSFSNLSTFVHYRVKTIGRSSRPRSPQPCRCKYSTCGTFVFVPRIFFADAPGKAFVGYEGVASHAASESVIVVGIGGLRVSLFFGELVDAASSTVAGSLASWAPSWDLVRVRGGTVPLELARASVAVYALRAEYGRADMDAGLGRARSDDWCIGDHS